MSNTDERLEHVQDHAHPDENLPEGSVVDGAELSGDVDDVYDFVVVGSGA